MTSDSFSNDTTPTAPFEEKTPAQRAALPEEEQELVANIEAYLTSQANPYSRSLTEATLNRAFVDLAFEFGFKRDNLIFTNLNSLAAIINKGQTEDQQWYANLSNSSVRTLQVFDKPTKKQLTISAEYIDNQSDTTVVVHHGYRSNPNNLMAEAKFFNDLGYNVLLPHARSHGKSQGEYITFGLYEKEDLTNWLDQEVSLNPQQSIYLYGASMGAATVMLSQEKQHPNVKGLIEDCGYATVEQQFRSMIRLLTSYIQYIPGFNLFDWYGKETKLLELLNERHLKPTLEMDLFTVSPLESVRRSGVPSLFIHGEADWFIKPSEKDLLFANAIGYKEQLSIPNAGHVESFQLGGQLYQETIISFIETIEKMETQGPIVAEDVNLLQNPTFAFSRTHIDNWLTSVNGQRFHSEPLVKNKQGEFILAHERREDLLTLSDFDNGLRFFNRYSNSPSFVGQEIPVIAGQTYELSLTAQNQSLGAKTYPAVIYGFNQQLKKDALRTKNQATKKTTYQARANDSLLVTLGATVERNSWLDRHYTYTALSNVAVVNNDRTPPVAVTLNSLTAQGDTLTVSGRGEANTTVLVRDLDDQIVSETATDGKGFFTLTITKQPEQGILHIVNADIKGNTSASKLIIFQ